MVLLFYCLNNSDMIGGWSLVNDTTVLVMKERGGRRLRLSYESRSQLCHYRVGKYRLTQVTQQQLGGNTSERVEIQTLSGLSVPLSTSNLSDPFILVMHEIFFINMAGESGNMHSFLCKLRLRHTFTRRQIRDTELLICAYNSSTLSPFLHASSFSFQSSFPQCCRLIQVQCDLFSLSSPYFLMCKAKHFV